jgi:hypothetical protein
MRPPSPDCGTVSNAQLFTRVGSIATAPVGTLTSASSPRPPASSTQTVTEGSSVSRPAATQPPEPPPTTM